MRAVSGARWEASILHQLASVHMLRESYAEAAFAAEEAIAIYQELVIGSQGLGMVAQDLKDRHSEVGKGLKVTVWNT